MMRTKSEDVAGKVARDEEAAPFVADKGIRKATTNPIERLVTGARVMPRRQRDAMIFAATAVLMLIGGASNFRGSSPDPMMTLAATRRTLSVATWNIAAINNNPFEYWITFDNNPEYDNIMNNVEQFIENPGENDIPVSSVFTDTMFADLEREMQQAGWPNVRNYWETDYRNRKIVSGFLKDASLGSKRLASMPDRVTNKIDVVGSNDPVFRPAVISMYSGDLGSVEKWWKAWEPFMFGDALPINTKSGQVSMKPFEMLKPISKTKYPSISEEEEAVSLPLQTMCGAILDAIHVHMMNTVSKPSTWQSLKKTMVETLNKKKVQYTLDILANVYGNADVITLQEVSGSLVDEARNGVLGQKYWITLPEDMDATRDQNSVIMLNRNTFPQGPVAEITSNIIATFPDGVPVSKGDINALTTVDADGIPYVIASFHGDTDGLATIPVNQGLVEALKSPELSQHKLIFGLDANTYEHAKPGKQQDVLEWGQHYVSNGLTSCWGDVPQPNNYTTFNARTYLQTQLNKACKSTEKRKGDVNPKDFILFRPQDFDVIQTWKDNTGNREYVEDMAFPTLNFPSDHGVLATVLERK